VVVIEQREGERDVKKRARKEERWQNVTRITVQRFIYRIVRSVPNQSVFYIGIFAILI